MQISKGTFGEYSVGGMSVLVACGLNLIIMPLILFAMDLRLDLMIHNSLNLRDKMAGLVAGAGSGLCDIFNAQGLESITSAH